MQIIKRVGASKKQIIIIRLIAIMVALVASGIFILCWDITYYSIFEYDFRSTVLKLIKSNFVRNDPLTITSLGILVAFKMKFANIGGEGQILMVLFGATYVALFMDWPQSSLLSL